MTGFRGRQMGGHGQTTLTPTEDLRGRGIREGSIGVVPISPGMGRGTPRRDGSRCADPPGCQGEDLGVRVRLFGDTVSRVSGNGRWLPPVPRSVLADRKTIRPDRDPVRGSPSVGGGTPGDRQDRSRRAGGRRPRRLGAILCSFPPVTPRWTGSPRTARRLRPTGQWDASLRGGRHARPDGGNAQEAPRPPVLPGEVLSRPGMRAGMPGRQRGRTAAPRIQGRVPIPARRTTPRGPLGLVVAGGSFPAAQSGGAVRDRGEHVPPVHLRTGPGPTEAGRATAHAIPSAVGA